VLPRGSARDPVPKPPLRLTYPIKPNNHAALNTIDEASAYLNSLRAQIGRSEACERAANLARQVSDNPSKTTIDEFTRQLELALLVAQRLDPILEIVRPIGSISCDDSVEGWAARERGGMKRFFSVLLGALLVVGGIWTISNRYGGGVQTFAQRWCDLIGVSDPLSVHVAAGIFSGAALIVSVYLCYAVVAQAFWALFAGWRR
jgi:hypothetical protein